MWQQFLAVFLILGLLLAALGLLRRQGIARFATGLVRQGAKPRQMQVLERVALDARHSLHLVTLNGRLVLVGVSPGGCCQIATFPADAALPPDVLRDRGVIRNAETAS